MYVCRYVYVRTHICVCVNVNWVDICMHTTTLPHLSQQQLQKKGIPRTDFKVAFRMFDQDNSGFIDRAELVELLQVLRLKNPFAGKARDFFNPFHTGSDRDFSEQTHNPPALSAFFGDNDCVTYEDFVRVFNELNEAVQRLEFDRYDKGRTGFISARDFGLALIGYVRHKVCPTGGVM
jgi:Ca2+-binding EF-hand superfamily protein